ncbi:MAG TPA: endonuclease/exonuclease/phosphatase family protein [Actinophytocola sp.]|jgi:endonuclease/exonuclease/phosphatase family metal-dependent hydrolase
MSRRVHSRILRPVGLVSALALGLVAPLALPASAAQSDRGGERRVFGPVEGDTLSVMSFNLKFASPVGPNSWRKRRPVMAELLRAELPAVLGTQEGLHRQLLDIEHDLPDHYDWVGEGRAGGTADEHCAIFFDTRRLSAVDSGNFWLSDTPDVPGSRSWGNTTVRMATWVRLRDRRTGTELAVLNTHLDNVSETSRVRSAELIRDRLNAIPAGLPVIVTGDFNAVAGRSAAYSTLVEGARLTDTWIAAAEHRGPLFATWHGYHPLTPDGPRIDWMFVRGDLAVAAAGVNTYSRDGQFPSDHLPIQALLTPRVDRLS